jgi:hypothetical protein
LLPRRTRQFAAASALALAGACTGPTLRLHNPEGHPVFVDGVATGSELLPFRYYGTTRWTSVPKDVDQRADWDHLPTTGLVELPAPASPWLFPLDLPLELLARLTSGRGDTTTEVTVHQKPPDPRSEAELALAELTALTERATRARTSR